MFKSILTISIFLLFCLETKAQTTTALPPIYSSTKLNSFEQKADSLPSLNLKPSLVTQNYKSFYHAHLGVFCKFENKILKNSNVPVRMRLGSTEYVDKLERKVPAYRKVEIK